MTRRRISALSRPRTSPAPAQPAWQLQTAKARFSEVFRLARAEGPQWITRQGREAVVMMAAEQFDRLTLRARQPNSLVEFFAASPLAKANLKLERRPDYGRPVDL
jgi:prevent-host-death family protein